MPQQLQLAEQGENIIIVITTTRASALCHCCDDEIQLTVSSRLGREQ